MGDLIPLLDPTNYRRVGERIRRLLEEGSVEICPHAQERMDGRRVSILDVQYLLKYGRVTEHSRPYQQWRFRIDGKLVDGSNAACVVEINGHVILITVMKLR